MLRSSNLSSRWHSEIAISPQMHSKHYLSLGDLKILASKNAPLKHTSVELGSDAKEVLGYSSHLPQLESLFAISQALESLTQLKSLFLQSKSKLTGLADHFLKMPQLREWPVLKDVDAQTLDRIIPTSHIGLDLPELREVHLWFDASQQGEWVQPDLSSLSHLPALERLYIGGRFRPSDLEFLKDCRTLTNPRPGGMGLVDDSTADWIVELPRLIDLRMDCNSIMTDRGAFELRHSQRISKHRFVMLSRDREPQSNAASLPLFNTEATQSSGHRHQNSRSFV